MNEELKIIIKAVTESAQKAIKEVSGELENMSKTAKASASKVGNALKGIGKFATVAVGAIMAVSTALVALGKNSIQFQKEQARLNSAFMSAGATAEQATETYKDLYRFLGDTGKASEAAAHLAKITTNQKHLAEWTKITQGIYATFGDSLRIESLTEAANETIRVGKVTDTLADALNWAGVSEDEFNVKLAQTNSLSEREALLRSTLNDLYMEASNIYERNNKALLEYNESQARLDRAMASAGASVMPLLTALNNLGSAFFTALKPALDAIIPPIATFVNWIAKAIQSVLSFFSALTGKSMSVKGVGEISGAVADASKSLGTAATGAKNLGSEMANAQKSASGASKALEDAKKHTQGFDELNIVSSDKTAASGSGGGSGSGSSAPGYAVGGGFPVDSVAFGTEVEESESLASGLAVSIKEAFADMAKVFEPTIKAWGTAFETVKKSWNKAKPDFINGAKEIQKGFSTLGSYLTNEFVPNVVNSFSVNLAPVIGDTLGFAIEEAGKAFNWLGEQINIVINDVVIPVLQGIETVATDIFSAIGSAWEEHGAPLLENLSLAFENVRGHLENFYNNVFKPVWDNVVVVCKDVWENGLGPLVEDIVDGVLSIANELTIFYNKVLAPIIDWIITKILPPITKVLNGIVKVLGEVIKSISKSISGVIKVIEGIIKFLTGVFTGDWEKAWEGCQKIFEGFADIIEGIIKTLKSILKGIADFVTNVVANAFKIAWEIIKGVWDVVVKFFKSIWDGIVQVFSPVGEWFRNTFTNAWNNVKTAWSGATSWFSGIWTNVKNTFSSVGSWFKTTFSNAWNNIKNVFSGWGSFFSGLWDKIKNTFSKLGTNLSSAISSSVKSGINGVISMIEKTMNKGVNLINGAIDLINELPGVNVGKVKKLSLPKLAKGGIVDSATIAMIGERGKEAVIPLENNTEWIDKLADRIASRSNTPTKVVLQVGEKELGSGRVLRRNHTPKSNFGIDLFVEKEYGHFLEVLALE